MLCGLSLVAYLQSSFPSPNGKKAIVMSLEAFITEYAKQLAHFVKEDETKPMEERHYAFGSGTVPKVVERMKEAVVKGSFNKDSKGIKGTCKVLGIPHTYQGIAAYVKPE